MRFLPVLTSALLSPALAQLDAASRASEAIASATSVIAHHPGDILGVYESLTSEYGAILSSITGAPASEFASITSLVGAVATDQADGIWSVVSHIFGNDDTTTSSSVPTVTANADVTNNSAALVGAQAGMVGVIGVALLTVAALL